MEYPLPGPVVALLQEEKASLQPKSYFISSGKKSIKITLVYAKDQHHDPQQSSSGCSSSNLHRKKSRNTSSSRHKGKKPSGRKKLSKTVSDSPTSSTGHASPGSSSAAQSEAEGAFGSPIVEHHGCRDKMSTVDSGHPSSLGTQGNDHGEGDIDTGSGSEIEEDDDRTRHRKDSDEDSSDSERPVTPGRGIVVAPPTLGPGETPYVRREEMWQTWTRIPRESIPRHMHRKQLLVPISKGSGIGKGSSSVPSSRNSPGAKDKSEGTNATLRRPRLHEGVSWDGSGQ